MCLITPIDSKEDWLADKKWIRYQIGTVKPLYIDFRISEQRKRCIATLKNDGALKPPHSFDTGLRL